MAFPVSSDPKVSPFGSHFSAGVATFLSVHSTPYEKCYCAWPVRDGSRKFERRRRKAIYKPRPLSQMHILNYIRVVFGKRRHIEQNSEANIGYGRRPHCSRLWIRHCFELSLIDWLEDALSQLCRSPHKGTFWNTETQKHRCDHDMKDIVQVKAIVSHCGSNVLP